MLKSSASREAEEDFMREVEVMSSFRNEHILTLIGIVLRGKNTLRQFIAKTHKPNIHSISALDW
jgi:Protein tyrosine and serine/threonine kinase